ncbi:hypothetical protein CL622_06080 [archaeon]|nr:hypothetical protein [archaeon]|tara:strand:- start:991 stop:1239 length:249 start_codon:yes stop_codon:yes gene_type:complete
MVNRSYVIKSITFPVEKERRVTVVRKIKELYPELTTLVKGKEVTVKGDLHNYKQRDMIVWLLSGGKIGTNIHAGEEIQLTQL